MMFELPKPKNNYEKADLVFALKNLLSEMDRLQSHKITFENITVESKMKQILNSLKDRDFISLPELVQKGESKLAVSVILVAGLGLVTIGKTVKETQISADCWIPAGHLVLSKARSAAARSLLLRGRFVALVFFTLAARGFGGQGLDPTAADATRSHLDLKCSQ